MIALLLTISFYYDVRPIFWLHCKQCHVESVREDWVLQNWPAPLLIERIRDNSMPPLPRQGLSDEETKIIEEWIREA